MFPICKPSKPSFYLNRYNRDSKVSCLDFLSYFASRMTIITLVDHTNIPDLRDSNKSPPFWKMSMPEAFIGVNMAVSFTPYIYPWIWLSFLFLFRWVMEAIYDLDTLICRIRYVQDKDNIFRDLDYPLVRCIKVCNNSIMPKHLSENYGEI